MPDLFWDVESRSGACLRLVGPWNYAAHPTTEILCLCYAINDSDIETWLPGQLVPEAFLTAVSEPSNWRLIAHNFEFERAMLEHVLVPKHGFPSIPLEVQHCSMAVALANAYPAELETLAKALELPYQKDREGLLLMRQMSHPRKPRKGEDKTALHWIFDAEKLARLIEYCAQDVRTSRAIWRHPKIKPLIASERRIQILDTIINRRGVRADRELATAARDMAAHERNAINIALQEHTEGEIMSVDQVSRILAYAVEHGHTLTSVNRRSVSAVLAAELDEATRTVLELRRDGARASVQKYERILAYANDVDDRMRGTLRMYGGGPGRWSGRGPQLQNLKKNEGNIPLAAVDAVRANDRMQLRQYGNPLTVLSDIARAAICAAPGRVLMAADFGAIESRILAWLSGEAWKLETYRESDRTNDKAKEPYRVVAAKMLCKNDPAGLSREERNKGKAGDLACGFGGSVGAWRRIVPDDPRSDPEILADIRAWRDAHPRTVEYWRELSRAIRIAIRTRQPFAARAIVASFENGNLYLALPSGRRITYPQTRLTESKFEGAPPDVTFKDNARGKWSDYRGWFGTFIENVVQGTARDLLAAAIERFEARGIPIVLTVHDECIAEVLAGSITEAEFVAILLEPPAWAVGLPLAGKVWSGTHYLEPPEETPPSPPSDGNGRYEETPETEPDKLIDELIAEIPPPAERDGTECLADLGEDVAPLFDLVSVPLTDDRKAQCPFHADNTPSLQFYADHFHCFGCGEHGDRIDWLSRGEGLTREEAIAQIQDWDGPVTPRHPNAESKIARALALWAQGIPIAGTIAERYLTETRHIDVTKLPVNVSDSLRFARCPFGVGPLRPCLIALMRDPERDEPIGIQRIALELREGRVCKIDRFTLGRIGAIKPWPAASDLVVGEGLETTLAAATRIPYRGGALQPAWSVVSSGGLSRFPHHSRGRAADHPGRSRRQWQRPGRRRTLSRALDPRRAHRHSAHPQARRRRFQRPGHAAVGVMSSNDDFTEDVSEPCPEGRGVTIDDFVAYLPSHVYIFTPCREVWTGVGVNARLPRMQVLTKTGKPKRDKNGNIITIPATTWLDRNRAVVQMTWCPGFPMLIRDRLVVDGGWIERADVTCFNHYRPPRIKLGDAAKAGPWLDHVSKIYPDDANHIVTWLAHRVQRPQEKINHALVLGGPQGIGKDSLLEPVKQAVGPWNFHDVVPANLLGRFNSFAKSAILRVNEARDLGDAERINRFTFYDHTKIYTAAPPDVLRVDEKHLREYYVFNVLGFLITTNHKTDGIYLPADDRRHYVAWSNFTKEDFIPDYWSALWSWYCGGGFEHVAAYLSELDISSFDPKAPPPQTSAWWDIVSTNQTPEDAELADVIDAMGNPDAMTVKQLIAAATGAVAEWLSERRSRRALPHRLERCGYVAAKNPDARDGAWKMQGVRQWVYGRAELPSERRITAARKLAGP